jgi:hypothetical protein
LAEQQASAARDRCVARAEAIAAAAAARAAALCGVEPVPQPVPPAVVPPWRITPSALHEAVALRAYFIAEQRGFAPGLETEDWFAAERDLKNAAKALLEGDEQA